MIPKTNSNSSPSSGPRRRGGYRKEEKRSSAEAERRLNPKLPESAAAGSGLFRERVPLGLVVLKNPADQQADVWQAFDQLQTYQAEIFYLLVSNEAITLVLKQVEVLADDWTESWQISKRDPRS